MKTKLKICGLTRDCDIAAVNEAMPDYAGFVFAKSRRQLKAEDAAQLRQHLDPHILPVGVFVEEEPEQICKLYREGIIAVAQLHGAESPAYVAALKKRLGLPIIKAIGVTNTMPQTSLLRQYEEAGADFFLFDQGNGGTGISFDWSLLPETDLPFFLAGGLHIENVMDGVKKTKPYGVDVSSGVETNGLKDRDKIIAFAAAIRKEG